MASPETVPSASLLHMCYGITKISYCCKPVHGRRALVSRDTKVPDTWVSQQVQHVFPGQFMMEDRNRHVLQIHSHTPVHVVWLALPLEHKLRLIRTLWPKTDYNLQTNTRAMKKEKSQTGQVLERCRYSNWALFTANRKPEQRTTSQPSQTKNPDW